MPHVIVEHSRNFDGGFVRDLILQIHHQIAKAEGNFSIEACKGRAISYDNYVLADDKKPCDFFHVTIKILEGRSVEIRAKLSKNITELLKPQITKYKEANHIQSETGLSVLIEEMNKDIYQKIPI